MRPSKRRPGYRRDRRRGVRRVVGAPRRPRPRACPERAAARRLPPDRVRRLPEHIVAFYTAFGRFRCEREHVALFGKPEPGQVRRAIERADVVYVGGGNTANMLAVWRLHGLDRLLRGEAALPVRRLGPVG